MVCTASQHPWEEGSVRPAVTRPGCPLREQREGNYRLMSWVCTCSPRPLSRPGVWTGDLGHGPGKELRQNWDCMGMFSSGSPNPDPSETAQYHFLRNPQPSSATWWIHPHGEIRRCSAMQNVMPCVHSWTLLTQALLAPPPDPDPLSCYTARCWSCKHSLGQDPGDSPR